MENGEQARQALKDLRNTIAAFKRGVHLLILDDSKEDRDLFEHTLKSAGLDLTVHHAETIESALALARDQKMDLMFIDLKLAAGRSGLEIMQHIDAPSIVITGLDDNSELVDDAVKSGAAVVRKPLSPQHFHLVNIILGAIRHGTT